MPAIAQNPNPNNNLGQVVSNGAGPSASVWQYPNTPAQSIINFQTLPSQPLPGGTSSATGLLTPPALIQNQMRNFSPAVFDLSPDSALVHFMQALLGDTGVGQLRKRQLMTRFQEALSGTQFYDLDAFYGALFSALRGPDGSLPVNPSTGLTFNPYTELASPDAWDDVKAADARFRERIIQLAKAINLGGTVAGLRALGEAISGVKCHVYETWRIIDRQGPQTGVITAGTTTSYTQQVTWSQLQAKYALWSSIPLGLTWYWLQGFTTTVVTPGTTSSFSPPLGGLGVNCRSEVVVMPRKRYGTDLASKLKWGADQYGIETVLEVLKPANVLLSVAQEAQEILTSVPVAAAFADSEYWEITYTVTPTDCDDPAYQMGLNSLQRGAAPSCSGYPVPKPPDTDGQGTNISYAGEVSAAWAYGTWVVPANIFHIPPGHPVGRAPNIDKMKLGDAITLLKRYGWGINHVSYEYVNLAADEITAYYGFPIWSYTQEGTSVAIGLNSPFTGGAVQPSQFTQYAHGQVVDKLDYEIEHLAGQRVTYYPQLALMDPIRATSMRTSGSQGVKAAPYAGPRIPVMTHG